MNDFIVSFFKTKKSITKNMLYLLFFKLVYNNNTFTLFLVFKQHRNFFKRKSKKILLKKLSKNLLFIYNKKFMTKYLFYRKSNVSLVCNLNSVNIFLKKKLKKKIFNNFSLAKKILIKKLIKRKKKFKVKKFKIRKKLINRKKYEKEENIKYKKFMFLPNISKPTRKIVFKVDLARCFVYKKINFKNSYVVRLKKKKKKRRRRRKHIFIRKKAMYKAKLYCRFIIKLKSKSQNFFINKRLISIFKRRLVRRRFIRRYLKRQKKKKRKRRLRIRKRKFLHSLKRA